MVWAQDSIGFGTEWTIGGFLDDDLHALDSFDKHLPIIGSVAEYQPQSDDVFVCAIGSPTIKRECVETMLSKKVKFISLIHESVIIGDNVKIGAGVILCPRCILTVAIEVGDHTALNRHVSVGHDARLGKFCQLSSHVDITGGVVIEDEVFIGSHACVLPKVTVEKKAVVGAATAVISRVPSEATVMGVPGRKI